MLITEKILKEIEARALMNDRKNRFPEEDYQALKEIGYYKAQVPEELGGLGLSLKEIAHEQIRLSMAAPGTALGINMHQIIVGVAARLYAKGHLEMKHILEEAVQGELYGFAISEPNNDRMLFGSSSEAFPQADGSYTVNGTKIFISMAEQATRFLSFAMDTEKKQSVFFTMVNDPEFVKVDQNWDVMGMRATHSKNMKLLDLKVEPNRILTTADPGSAQNPLIFSIFIYFELLLAASYHGVGKKALEEGIAQVKTRKSLAKNISLNQDPLIRYRIAEAAMRLEGIESQIDRICDDVENDVDHGVYWLPRLSTLKNHAVESAMEAVEEVVRALGGKSYANSQFISMLYRDVLAGVFQPSDQESVHESWANVLLGRIQ